MKKCLYQLSYIGLTVMLFAVSGCIAMKSRDDGSLVRPGARIVFFGDSITQGGAQPGGYVTLVADSMARRYPGQGVEVIGAGISGNKVPDLLARLDRDVLSRKPTVVVVYIGINDVWHWDTPGRKGTTETEFEAGLMQLVNTLKASGAEVVLSTPSVIGEKRAGTNKQDVMLDKYSDIIRSVAARTDVRLNDLRLAFNQYLARQNRNDAEKGILTTDGVHLNAVGNRFVAERMIDALTGR